MMLRSLFVVMAFCLSFATSHAAPNPELKQVIDELNYSLNVEWDQKDQTFYQARAQEFATSLEKLRAEGLSDGEIVDFLSSEMKQTIKTISLNKMSPAEAHAFIKASADKAYASGASWTSRSHLIGGVAAFTIIVTVIVFGQVSF